MQDKAEDSVYSTGNTGSGTVGSNTGSSKTEENITDNSPPSSEGLKYETIATANGSYIKIVGYEGHSANVLVPAFIHDIPVTYIAGGAFKNNDVIRTITFEGADDLSKRQFYLPASSNCAPAVFYNLPNLTKITFPYELSYGRYLADYSCTPIVIPGVIFLKEPRSLRQSKLHRSRQKPTPQAADMLI